MNAEGCCAITSNKIIVFCTFAWMYFALRFLHLLLMASILPLSFFYIREVDPAFFQELGDGYMGLLSFAAVLVSMIFILFEQRYFPEDTKTALTGVLLLSGNLFAASLLQKGAPFFAAYSVAVRLVFTYFVYYGFMTWSFLDREKRKKLFHYQNDGYITLLLLLFVLTTALLIALSAPFTRAVGSQENYLFLCFYFSTFGFDLLWNIRHMLKNNIFNFDIDGKAEERDATLTRWALPTILICFAGAAVAIVIACWDRM